MPDPDNATVDAGALPPSGPPPNAADASDAAGEAGLYPGQRWRNLVIEAPFGGLPRCFTANHVGRMETVVVRAFPVGPAVEWRRGAWERLCALTDSKVIRCIEAHEESGWRYEVTALPPPMTLREWMAANRLGFAETESFMRQMAAALGTLHGQGVVHLNLRPESIYIDETKGEPIYLLGGLHEATLYTQSELTPAEVDPFYAPPEAAGLTKHPPGTRLCAWDWWSVGRVVQEFLLGKHVLALVLDRDVSRVTPDLRRRAELLLLEREPTGVRAGALEFTMVESSCMPLLRGLLTTAVEARWGLDAVQRWLKREPVRDHYDLPRNARMWSWKGRIFTVAEAAEFFTEEKNWEAGEDMLFHPHEPETLAHFLSEVPAHRADWERLQAVCDLAEGSGWEQLPVVARRTVTAAVAWLTLAAASGARPTFRVRGQAMDVAGLGELLKASGPDAGVALVSAILSPAVIQAVEPLDASAARVLKGMAAKGGAAVAEAVKHGWLDPDDPQGHARMLELSLLSGAVLREKVDLLRATHATSAHPELARIFANKAPEAAELVILAYAAEAPERHGFITHENWRRKQCVDFTEKGRKITRVLLWLRLRQVLGVARLWGARSTVFAATVLVLTALATGISRSVLPPTVVAVSLLGSRAWLWWRVRGLVRRFDSEAAAWTWSDGLERCRAEATRVNEGKASTAGELARELREVRAAIAELVKAGAPKAVVHEPFWWDVVTVIAVALVATAGALVQPLTRETIAAPLPVEAAQESVAEIPAEAKPAEEPPPTPETLLATGRYEVEDDGFGRRLRGPLQPWPHRPPPIVAPMVVDATALASPEQAAFALVSGAVLLHPYPRKAVSVYLALRVPTTRGFGVMIFNARDRELAQRDVLLMHTPLREGTWYELKGRRILYLGVPRPLEAEISLAPR